MKRREKKRKQKQQKKKEKKKKNNNKKTKKSKKKKTHILDFNVPRSFSPHTRCFPESPDIVHSSFPCYKRTFVPD